MKKDNVGFWSKFKRMGSSRQHQSDSIDGVNDPLSIANLWATIYENRFSNSNHDEVEKKALLARLDGESMVFRITSSMMNSVLRKLGNNKSIGPDGIQAEDLKFCPSSAINALMEILNLAFAHSFLPASMLDVRLTPIVKKKVCLIIRVEIIGLLL